MPVLIRKSFSFCFHNIIKYFVLIVCFISTILINDVTTAYEVIVENITDPWIIRVPKDEMLASVEQANNKLDNFEQFVTVSENFTGADSNGKKMGPPEHVQKPRRIMTAPLKGSGPTGMDDAESTTCDEFSKNARFNPYSVLGEKWFAFYMWAPDNAPLVLEFQIPSTDVLAKIRKVLDPQVQHPIDWDARKVLMIDLMYNATALLVERGDRGQYWLYAYVQNLPEKFEPVDLRLKQVRNNKYLALMECHDERVYALSRLQDIPAQENLQVEAAEVGYRGRGGRSYLYQGHKWMPIPEMDEIEYWTPPSYHKERHIPNPYEVNEQLDDNILRFTF